MNPSRETRPATADLSCPLSRRAIVLSLLSLPAALAGCGGGDGGELPLPEPSAASLPQGYTLAYRIDPPGVSEGRVSTGINLTRDGTLLLTQSIPSGNPNDAMAEGVLTSFTNFGRPQNSVTREVLRVPEMAFVRGSFYPADGGIVFGTTSASEIFVPGRFLSGQGTASPPTFFVLSAQGEVRRSVVINLPAVDTIVGIVECPDGTLVGRGTSNTDDKEMIVRMDAQGNYLNTVMEGANLSQKYAYGSVLPFYLRSPAVTPSGDVYVFCMYGNLVDVAGRREGFLTTKLDGAGQRFIPAQPPRVPASIYAVRGATFSDGEGNLYVEARAIETYPNRYTLNDGNPTNPTPPHRGAVQKFTPDGTELGVALLPPGIPANSTIPFIDAAVDGSGNIYAITDDGAIHVYQRSR